MATTRRRKLNQVVAIEKDAKETALKAVTEHYHTMQKAGLFSGIKRTYVPFKDEPEHQIPSETTNVTMKIKEILDEVSKSFIRLFDVTATKEWGNTAAVADVTVNGKVIVAKAPVSYLLFLEKQIVNLRTVVTKLPTLDPTENWHYNEHEGVYETAVAKTLKTKKTMQRFIKAEATDKHPAQVETYNEDVPIGTWSTVKLSGAIPPTDLKEYLARIDALLVALKEAREEANNLEVEDRNLGEQVFGYLFS